VCAAAPTLPRAFGPGEGSMCGPTSVLWARHVVVFAGDEAVLFRGGHPHREEAEPSFQKFVEGGRARVRAQAVGDAGAAAAPHGDDDNYFGLGSSHVGTAMSALLSLFAVSIELEFKPTRGRAFPEPSRRRRPLGVCSADGRPVVGARYCPC
jgi:hypothetical protein